MRKNKHEELMCMLDNTHEKLMYMLDEMALNLEDINESLNNISFELHNRNTTYKPKHAKREEDEVLEIFNDLISDLDNVNVTIIKKDN